MSNPGQSVLEDMRDCVALGVALLDQGGCQELDAEGWVGQILSVRASPWRFKFWLSTITPYFYEHNRLGVVAPV
jgi:hypothetical protein